MNTVLFLIKRVQVGAMLIVLICETLVLEPHHQAVGTSTTVVNDQPVPRRRVLGVVDIRCFGTRNA